MRRTGQRIASFWAISTLAVLAGCAEPGGGASGSSGAASTALPAPQASAVASSTRIFDYGPSSFCRVRDLGSPPIGRGVASGDHASGSGREALTAALEWLGLAISSAAGDAGPERARTLASGLSAMAEAEAFTQARGDGGSDPRHWQMNLLKVVSIGFDLTDARDAWAPGERARVKAWGDRLWSIGQDHRGWPDTNAVVGAAGVFWGVASENAVVLNKGLRRSFEVQAAIERDGALDVYFPSRNPRYHGSLPPGWGVRINDKMIGDLVMAAFVADKAGVDLFDAPNASGGTLGAAVGWWDGVLFADAAGSLDGQDLDFFRTTGQEASWSWTEYWAAARPDDPATARLRDQSLRIAASKRHGYVGLATGPASCLLR